MPPGGKIGAHGLSMGGMIAVHLARKGLVEFLFVDRTFYDLSEVPKYSMARWTKYAVKFLTLWSDLDSTDSYIYSNCYKVVAQDPNDEIINDNASIKTGISLKVVSFHLYFNSIRSKMN
jgi:hypothetical protein